ncbi:MAG TPA: hypothetical protein ENI23_12605 [bacterium]|nr:hypothetical protein [bacterium]
MGVIIRRLKELGLVEQWKSNGKRRWLRARQPSFEEQEQHPFHTERPRELQGYQREMKGDQFTGWFVTKEIVNMFRENMINAKELLLLANINNLSKTEDGCYASNAYLGKQLHISEERIRQYLVHLIGLGLIEKLKPNGRNRMLKPCFGNCHNEKTHDNPQENPVQSSQENPGLPTQENPAHIIQVNNNTKERKENTFTKVNVRQEKSRRSPKKPDGLLSKDEDKQAAGELRSILIEKDSDLLRTSFTKEGKVSRRPVTIDTLTKMFFRIRTERKVAEQDIISTLDWLRKNWDDPYTPKIRTSTDLFDKWEMFRDAQLRQLNGKKSSAKVKRMEEACKQIIAEMEVV